MMRRFVVFAACLIVISAAGLAWALWDEKGENGGGGGFGRFRSIGDFRPEFKGSDHYRDRFGAGNPNGSADDPVTPYPNLGNEGKPDPKDRKEPKTTPAPFTPAPIPAPAPQVGANPSPPVREPRIGKRLFDPGVDR